MWTFRYRVSRVSDVLALETSWQFGGTIRIYVATAYGVRSNEGSEVPFVVGHDMEFPWAKAVGKMMKGLNQTFIWGGSPSMA